MLYNPPLNSIEFKIVASQTRTQRAIFLKSHAGIFTQLLESTEIQAGRYEFEGNLTQKTQPKKNLIQITRLTQETQQYSTFIYIQSFPINRIRGIAFNLLYDTQFIKPVTCIK